MSDKTDTDIANGLREFAERTPRHQDGRALLEAADRLIQRSVLINKIAWQLHDAMGVIPEGADRNYGDIEADLGEICATIRRVREVAP